MPPPASSKVVRASTVIRALLLGLAGSLHTVAQQPVDTTVTPTLHVYVNLIQVPVLVLDPHRHPKPPVASSQFVVSVGGRPPFHPRHVRREGSDPIALTLLIDASDPGESLWQNLPKTIDPLLENLSPQDTVDLYALDGCNLRHFGDAVAPDTPTLQSRIEKAVAIKPYELVRRQAGPCRNRYDLWSAMGYITLHLGTNGARHVLLMVTNGQPAAESDWMLKLGRLMGSRSLSVFAIANENKITGETKRIFDGHTDFRSDGSVFSHPLTVTDVLAGQCEMSGGLLLPSSAHGLGRTMAHAMDLVRGRYIVEFPRPDELGAGIFQIDVSIGDRFAFIRPGGASAPLADPKEARDPAVQHGIAAPEDVSTPAPDTGAEQETPVK